MASVFYRVMKYACTASLSFYFRKWQIQGAEHIPEGPVLFVPNHQNAFLDAIVVTCSSVKNPWYLTRANVFNKSFAAWMLNKLQMLPIYRFRDGYATLKKNDQVMEDVVKKLNNGQTVLIFAEGNHGDTYQLRPLQKGVARISMAVDKDSNVAIVPVGLQYDSRTAFRSRVLVNFGKPIYVNNFDFSDKGTQERIEYLLMEIRMKLQPLILHIETPGYDDKWEHLKLHRQYHYDLLEQLKSDQSIITQFPQSDLPASGTHKLPGWKNIIMWYWKINSLIPRLLIQNLIINKLKDPQFTGSVKYAAGMFLFPIFWLMQTSLIFYYTGSVMLSLLYFISIPAAIRLS